MIKLVPKCVASSLLLVAACSNSSISQLTENEENRLINDLHKAHPHVENVGLVTPVYFEQNLEEGGRFLCALAELDSSDFFWVAGPFSTSNGFELKYKGKQAEDICKEKRLDKAAL